MKNNMFCIFVLLKANLTHLIVTFCFEYVFISFAGETENVDLAEPTSFGRAHADFIFFVSVSSVPLKMHVTANQNFQFRMQENH